MPISASNRWDAPPLNSFTPDDPMSGSWSAPLSAAAFATLDVQGAPLSEALDSQIDR
jgi:hypothetical protein